MKSFFIYLPSLLLPRLATFLLVFVGAKLLAPDEFGYFSLIVLIGEFCEMALGNWTRIAMARLGATSRGLSREFVLLMARLAVMSTFGALCFSVGVVFLVAPERAGTLALAVVAYILSSSIIRFGVSLHQTMENRAIASTLEATRATFAFAASVIAMSLSGRFLETSLATSVVNVTIGAWAVYDGMRLTNRTLSSTIAPNAIFAFGIPLVVIAFLSYAIASLDKVLLKSFHTAADLGYYAAAFAVGRSGFDIVANAFNIGAFVGFSKLSQDGQSEETRALLSQQIGNILAIALPAAGVLVAAREMIGRVLFPPAYLDTFVQVIPLVALGAIALNLKNFAFDNVFHVKLKNLRQIPSLAIGAAVSTLLGFWLLPSLHAVGAAIMFSGGAVCSLGMSILLSRTLIRLQIPWETTVSSAAIGVAAFGVIEIGKLMFAGAPPIVGLALAVVTAVLAIGLSLLLAIRAESEDPSPPVVMHVISSLAIGGAEKMLCDLLAVGRGSRDFRYQLLIINDHVDDGLITAVIKAGIRIHRLDRPPGSRNPKFILATIRIMLAERPAIVHCHNTHSLAWSILPAWLLANARLFRTVHDTNTTLRTRVAYVWLLNRIGLTIGAISAIVESQCRSAGFRDVTLIHNGIELDQYRAGAKTAYRGLVICVGRLSIAIKGHDVLIEAIRLCRQRGAPLTVRLVGVEVPDELPSPLAHLEAQRDASGLGDAVEFLGARRDVSALLCDADMFVLPSRSEGFGLVLVEAMAAGLPVIASDIEGPREILDGGRYGTLFPCGDADALAHALITLHGSAALRSDAAEKSRRRALDFSIQSTAKGYEALYAARLPGRCMASSQLRRVDA